MGQVAVDECQRKRVFYWAKQFLVDIWNIMLPKAEYIL